MTSQTAINFVRAIIQTVMYDKYTPIAQTAPRLWQPPTTLSFRGAKRRGNPLNRNVNTVAIAIDLACSRNHYRAENLCYQFKQGQKLLPQFRKIVCLVCAPYGLIPAVTSFPRNDTGGTPTPDCHVERSRNISWKGNDVNCHKIICLVKCAFGASGQTNTSSRRTY